MRPFRALFIFSLAAALALALTPGGWGGVARARALAQATTCADFQFFEFAQSVYESDPAGWAALDPDGDGIPCPDLPSGVAPALWTDHVPEGAVRTTVVRVVDGDTIVVTIPAGEDTVRIIMTDTPETKSPKDPIECYGHEATDYTSWLLGQDADIYLEADITERDKYDRLLRYVWIDFGDGFVIQLNEAIVRSGHGVMVTYPPDVKYVDQIRAAQEFARNHNLGLWAACGGADTPLGIAAPTQAPSSASGGGSGGGDGGGNWNDSGSGSSSGGAAWNDSGSGSGNTRAGVSSSGGGCDPSYPTLCLPSSPDLDCGDISDRRFPVRPPDPHRFDGNHDGVGCESD